MKSIKKFLSLVIFLSLFLNVSVKAEELKFNVLTGDEVNTSNTINGSSVVIGNNVTTTDIVNGVDINFGNNINYKSTSDYALVAGNNVNVLGNIKNDGLILGNLITFDLNFSVERDLFIFGNSVNLNGVFNRDITIYATEVIVNDVSVLGNLTIYANNIEVKSQASVNKLSYNEDAIINIESENIKETALLDKLVQELSFKDKLIDFIINYGGMLILFAAIFFVFPNIFKNIENKFENMQLSNILSLVGFGALGLLVVPIISVMLLSFVLGTPLALLLITLYIIVICLSYIFSGYLIGYLLWNKFIKKEANQLLIGLIGITIVSVLSVVPFIGEILGLIFTLLGIGIVLKLIKRS